MKFFLKPLLVFFVLITSCFPVLADGHLYASGDKYKNQFDGDKLNEFAKKYQLIVWPQGGCFAHKKPTCFLYVVGGYQDKDGTFQFQIDNGHGSRTMLILKDYDAAIQFEQELRATLLPEYANSSFYATSNRTDNKRVIAIAYQSPHPAQNNELLIRHHFLSNELGRTAANEE